jgi:transposase
MNRTASLDLHRRPPARLKRRGGIASVVKWAQRARETGSPAARPMGGKRPYLSASQRSWLLARLDEKPDLTLHSLLRELGARGVTVSCDTLWRFLRREGFSFKKSVAASEQERPDVARRRAVWKRLQARLAPGRLVFLDETWTKTNMAPLRGWRRRVERLHAKVPHGHWKTLNFMAALHCKGIDAPS